MTTKHEIRRRTNDAVKLLLLGHSTSVVVGKVAEKEGCSRLKASSIAGHGETTAAAGVVLVATASSMAALSVASPLMTLG